MTSSRRKRLLAVLLAFAGLAAFVLWPNGDGMALLTSDPVTIQGQTVRFQVLGPADWQVKQTRNFLNRSDFFLRRPAPFAWLPVPLRHWLGVSDSVGPTALVHLGDPGSGPGGIMTIQGKGPKGVIHVYAFRSIQGPRGGSILYGGWDRKQFDATYRRVCESFRVVR